MKNPVWPYRALTREAYILTILALSDRRLPHTVAALGPRVSWCAAVVSSPGSRAGPGWRHHAVRGQELWGAPIWHGDSTRVKRDGDKASLRLVKHGHGCVLGVNDRVPHKPMHPALSQPAQLLWGRIASDEDEVQVFRCLGMCLGERLRRLPSRMQVAREPATPMQGKDGGTGMALPRTDRPSCPASVGRTAVATNPIVLVDQRFEALH